MPWTSCQMATWSAVRRVVMEIQSWHGSIWLALLVGAAEAAAGLGLRRVSATPASAMAPPHIASADGVSCSVSHESTMAIAGMARVVADAAPAFIRLRANAQVVKAMAVGATPR